MTSASCAPPLPCLGSLPLTSAWHLQRRGVWCNAFNSSSSFFHFFSSRWRCSVLIGRRFGFAIFVQIGVAGLPATDGVDMWPYFSGANASSPRTEVLLSTLNNTRHPNIMNQGGAGLIVGGWKLLRTHNNQTSITGGCDWTGPVYPNVSTPHWPRSPLAANCGADAILPGEKGWLFHIMDDPGEHTDVSKAFPLVHAKLLARALELDLTQIDGLKGDGWRGRPDPAAACAAAASNDGTWGPHLP